MPSTSAFVSGLADLFPAAWREEADRVPRHLFMPDTVWVEDGDGPVPVQRHQDPRRWLELCHEDRPLVTQLDDGQGTDRGYITSSASQPSIVGHMLEVTALAPGVGVDPWKHHTRDQKPPPQMYAKENGKLCPIRTIGDLPETPRSSEEPLHTHALNCENTPVQKLRHTTSWQMSPAPPACPSI